MSRRRDRGFVDGLELWRPSLSTPRVAPTAYVTIARLFEQIDHVMLDEIEEYLRGREQLESGSLREPLAVPERPWSIYIRQHKESESYIEDIRKRTSHTSSETDTFAYLTDATCVMTWSWVHSAILRRQGHSNQYQTVSWTQTKARANEILNLALAVLEVCDSDDYQDLLIPKREGISAGIEARLRTLLLFDSIYSRPNSENMNNTGNHEFIQSFDRFLRDRKDTLKATRKARSDRTHQNVSTLQHG